jgi:radical SAM protein with 4Fe4S-binding SPASM domain
MDPKTYLNKKNFCTLPWVGVYIQPNGSVRNCAITQEEIGNINQDSLDNILRGPINQNIKKDMLSDVFHNRCSQCHSIEKGQKNDFNQVSNRVWYLKTLKNPDLSIFDSPKNYQLRQLDLRWSNTCNFACVYCGPDLSSAWEKELNQPQNINEQALQKSLEYIYNNLQTIEHIYLAGGEPLLIKENINLLNKIKEINSDIEIRVNTNLSVVDGPIYKLLKTFKNVHWTVSVDNVGKDFEYVRYGGTWSKFVKNLQQLNKDFGKINFNLVWFVLNGSSILDCIDFLMGMGFHENTIIVNPLEYPRYWHVNNLPELVLDQIRNKIKDKLKTANPNYSLYNSLQLMLNYSNIPLEKNINATINELKKIDNRRNLDSSKIFTEIYNNQGK